MTTRPDRFSVRRIWCVTLAGAVVWLAATALAPWLAARGSGDAARLVYAAFAPVCHQIPGRCFFLEGHPLAVCARCLGIYAGFASGLALYPLMRGFSRIGLPSGRLLLLFTLPLALDGAGGILGAWQSPIGLRFVTGLAWGAVLPFYFVPGVADFFRAGKERAAGRALEMGPPKK